MLTKAAAKNSIKFNFCGLNFHILQDDLLLDAGVLGGNKARKIQALASLNLPYSLLISYGNAQSNAMAALARFAKLSGRKLIFFAARKIPIEGNLKSALDDGAIVLFADSIDACKLTNIIQNALQNSTPAKPKKFLIKEQEFSHYLNKNFSDIFSGFIKPDLSGFCLKYSKPEQKMHLAQSMNQPGEFLHPKELAIAAHRAIDSFFIPEGLAIYEARFGAFNQANDIKNFAVLNGLFPDSTAVFLPSGTGTSALFLEQALKEFCVISYAAVCKEAIWQTAEFFGIQSDLFLLQTSKKYHFARPKRELLNTLCEVKDLSGLDFEPIYDAPAFVAIKENAQNMLNAGIKDVIYIHQGGALGAMSMLKRYEKLAQNAAN